MALYDNIYTPRIYVDWINWLISIGKMSTSDITFTSSSSFASGSNLYELFDGDPTNVQTISCSGTTDSHDIIIDTNIGTDTNQATNFCAILGHNLKEADAKINFEVDDTGSGFAGVNITEIANSGGANGTSNEFTPSYNGWSMFTWSTPTTDNEKIKITIDDVSTYDSDVKIGAIIVGKYYDFPHPPDLKLSRDYQFNNKILQARGGHRYSNLQTNPAQNWVLDKWAISTDTSANTIKPLGRRSYQMTYSFMNSTNLLPPDNRADYLTENNSFYGDVLSKIQGSHVPFIFQTDNNATYTTARTPSDIILARMFNVKMSQTAVNHWSVSMIIEEEA